MAVFLRGMTTQETIHLTDSMIHSGKVLDWTNGIKNIVVDKHSTGGVGDKVSPALVPVLAACGLKVRISITSLISFPLSIFLK